MMGAREAAEIAFRGTQVIPATEGEPVSETYPPDAAAPMPEDTTDATPKQVAQWYAAECAYQHGIASYHLLKRSDFKAAADAFNASAPAFAIAHLIRALMEHAPDHVNEVVRDMQQTFVQGDAVEWAYQWLAESEIDAASLDEAGGAKAKESDTPAPRDTDLIQQVRALVKRYGAPAIAAEAARQAKHH